MRPNCSVVTLTVHTESHAILPMNCEIFNSVSPEIDNMGMMGIQAYKIHEQL